MAKINTLWIEDQTVVHYVADMHMPEQAKRDLLDKLIALMPTVKIIVTYEDGSILTYNPYK